MDGFTGLDGFERTQTTTHCSSSSWVWIILLVIAFMAIAGLVVWVVLLYRNRNTKDKIIDFTGANIQVASETSLNGTWSTTSTDPNDEVTLWATLHPPEIDSKGSVTNPNALSAKTEIGKNSVPLPGLQKGLKYYGTLIATNKKATNNYQVYGQLVYMGANPVPADGNFAIEDILQVGKIQLVDDKIHFNQKPSEQASLWKMYQDTTSGTPTSTSLIQNVTDDTKCLNVNSSGVLSTGICSDILGDANAKWIYNPTPFANRWCLANTINSTSNADPSCMVLGQISAGSATINVNDKSSAGDGWVNAFETT